MKTILKICYLYQITIWLISLILYIYERFETNVPNKDAASFLLLFAIIILSITIIVTNIYLFLDVNKNSRKFRFLQFNIWINLAQSIQFSIMGLNYFFIIGIHLLIYYSYSNIQNVDFAYNYSNLELAISVSDSNLIEFGIYIVPLLLCLVFLNEYNHIKNSQNSSFKKVF
jgi:hypothetical protein